MGILEILLSGIGFKGLEKPFVFITMLISYVFFMVIFVAVIIDLFNDFSPIKFFILMFILFLSGVCAHFMKKCFK
jgi:hypothetical protein